MDMKVWDMGSETSSQPRIPNFAKTRYMVTKVVPPKGKTVRDGLVMSAALIDFEDSDGKTIQVTKVTEGPAGYEIEFPLGKYLVSATKFRGPTSWYNFVNPSTGKWTKIPQEKFTLDFATSYLAAETKDWADLSEDEKNHLIDSYFEEMYFFGLACDFNLDTTKDHYDVPVSGMITSFYRRYTPPELEEKYGKVIITKWPSKKNEIEKAHEAINGSFEMKDAAIAEAIITALQTVTKPKNFDPTSDEALPF